jgi:hypothetical protein
MTMSRFRTIVFVFGFILGFNAVASAASPDYWPTEDWRTSSPEQQGMHSGTLADMLEFIQKEGYMLIFTLFREMQHISFTPVPKASPRHWWESPWTEDTSKM